MKLVEMYFALNTVETTEDYDNYIKRYEKELNQINENIIIKRIEVHYIKGLFITLLQDFDIEEVLDQAETLFNDILIHEAESRGKLSPNMVMSRDEALKIEKELI